ncbi:hypothetical protein SE37_07650 [Geobacter soli]|uniref:Uncharacterized protein n=1 Tax=Geobacter soli TaxID=1510391 RepID=A0A0C1TT25_9BACT|nr:hypothetical protein SE37_07650 [Geobacter soli]
MIKSFFDFLSCILRYRADISFIERNHAIKKTIDILLVRQETIFSVIDQFRNATVSSRYYGHSASHRLTDYRRKTFHIAIICSDTGMYEHIRIF